MKERLVFRLGRALDALGEHERAEECFRKVVHIPDAAEPILQFAIREGKDRLAERVLEKMEPVKADIYRGVRAAFRGEPVDPAVLDKAERLQNDSVYSYFARAYLQHALGRDCRKGFGYFLAHRELDRLEFKKEVQIA